jgi:hypothetical protein
MSDQPFYAPDHKGAQPRQPKPGERLWTMTVHGNVSGRSSGTTRRRLDAAAALRHSHPNREWALTEAMTRAEALRLRAWSQAEMEVTANGGTASQAKQRGTSKVTGPRRRTTSRACSKTSATARR